MNNAVKSLKSTAGMKELFLKLRFGNYLMAALTISSKKYSLLGCSLIEQLLLINQCFCVICILHGVYLQYFV